MNWRKYKLGDIARIGDGAHAKVRRQKEGVMYLTSKNFKGGKLSLQAVDYISPNDYEKLFSKESKTVRRPECGDLILGIIGTIGNVYRYKGDDFFGISSSVGLIRPNQDKILSEYLYYYITSKHFKVQQNAHNGASVQGYTNIPSLKLIEIYLPEIVEQRAIVEILSALDDKIELNLQMNKALEEMANALYKHWFIDFGPFRDQEFKESELGSIPESWNVIPLMQYVELLGGGTPKTTIGEYWDGHIYWVSAKDIGSSNGLFIVDTEKKITERGLQSSSTKILPEDTVIVVARGSVGKYGVIAKHMAMNQSCYGIRTKGKISQPLVFFMIKNLMNDLLRMAYGSVFDTITTDTFRRLRVAIPPEAKLNSVMKNLDVIFYSIKQNSIENQTLTATRDYLLPKLISGEIRVKEAEQRIRELV